MTYQSAIGHMVAHGSEFAVHNFFNFEMQRNTKLFARAYVSHAYECKSKK